MYLHRDYEGLIAHLIDETPYLNEDNIQALVRAACMNQASTLRKRVSMTGMPIIKPKCTPAYVAKEPYRHSLIQAAVQPLLHIRIIGRELVAGLKPLGLS